MGTSIFLTDAHQVVVGLREAILVDQADGMPIVEARHQTVLLLGIECHRTHGLGHIRTISEEWLRRRVVEQSRVAAQVTVAVEHRLQLLVGHAELHIIGHTGLLVEVRVETADVLISLRQTTVEQLTSTDNLHAPSAGTDESQKCLRNLSGPLSHSLSLVEASKVVHLKQYQPVVSSRHPLFVFILHLRCKTHLGQILGIETEQPVHRVVLLAHLNQRIDIA